MLGYGRCASVFFITSSKRHSRDQSHDSINNQHVQHEAADADEHAVVAAEKVSEKPAADWFKLIDGNELKRQSEAVAAPAGALISAWNHMWDHQA